MLAQTDPEQLREACGQEPSWVCRQVFKATDSDAVAELSDLLFGKVGGIVLILVVALLTTVLVRRAIGRFAAGLTDGATSQKLRRLRKRAPAALTETTMLSARTAARATTLSHVLESVATGMIWSIAIVTILGELGINLGPLIASAGIAGVALGFGAQSLVKDFLSGFFMLVEDQYGVGDIIDVGAAGATIASGTVEAVTLRTTRIRDVNGTVWHVPNGTIERVANMSQQWARALLDVNVEYGTDVALAEQVIGETAGELWDDARWRELILEAPEVWGVEELAPDAIHIRLVVKTKPAEQFRVMRELRRRLLVAFEAHGIEIAAGQRTIVIQEPAEP
jgi:moderate conductance mechanosensitive channel